MDKKALLKSANELKQPETKAAAEYVEKSMQLADSVSTILKNRLDLYKLIGENNLDMMLDNHRNHARFMSTMFINYNADVFLNTIFWVFRAYRSHGFSISYWPAMLDTWIEEMKKEMSADSFDQVYPFYHWMLIRQAAFIDISDKEIGRKESL